VQYKTRHGVKRATERTDKATTQRCVTAWMLNP
jgi:hypothetical protein